MSHQRRQQASNNERRTGSPETLGGPYGQVPRRALTVATLSLLGLLIASAAQANNYRVHYDNTWPYRGVLYAYTNSFATATAPSNPDLSGDRLIALQELGISDWEAHSGEISFKRHPNVIADFDPYAALDSNGQCATRPNGVHWGEIRENGNLQGRIVLGLTVSCITQFEGSGAPLNEIVTSNILYEERLPWHVGDGQNVQQCIDAFVGQVCANTIDFRSIATHEFGHFTGFIGTLLSSGDSSVGAHHSMNSVYCNGQRTYHTMCEDYSGGTDERGTASHDHGPYADAYGERWD